jgi:signal transduction histidine kinase
LEKWRSRLHPADIAKTQARFQEIFAKEDDFDLEFRVVSLRGEERDIRSRGFLQRNEQGVAVKMVGLVMDVTELRKLDRMKQEFVSMVSHELRTPLTSIRGALGILSSAGYSADAAKTRQLLELSNRNADRLAVLIDDILYMDKIESGKMQFDWATRDLNELVAQAVQTNAMYAERFGVKFVFAPSVNSIAVHVDANRLIQVLTNLLSNAAKFSPAGGSVDVTTEIRGSSARVSVRDHGPGIPVEFQSRIFGKFNQSDGPGSRSKTGSGLGLAISKSLVEAMKGTISFETKLGAGTAFYVDLPVASGVDEASERQSTLVAIDLSATSRISQIARERH